MRWWMLLATAPLLSSCDGTEDQIKLLQRQTASLEARVTSLEKENERLAAQSPVSASDKNDLPQTGSNTVSMPAESDSAKCARLLAARGNSYEESAAACAAMYGP